MWTGWGDYSRPDRDGRRIIENFGPDEGGRLLGLLKLLEDEFYSSDARHTVAGTAEMGDKAAADFRRIHPELDEQAVEALAWCYSFDYK